MNLQAPLVIKEFKPFTKNTLRGFVTIRFPKSGLEIRDICLHEKNGKRWLSMPAKPYQKNDGTKGWCIVVDFFDKQIGKKFQQIALRTIDTYRKGDGR